MINKEYNLDNEKINLKINPELLEKYRNKFSSLDESKRIELEASIGWLFLTDDIKKKRREQLQSIMRTNDIVLLILAFIGIFSNVISSSMYLSSQKVSDAEGKINIQLIPDETNTVFAFRVVTSITTLFLLIFLIRHYLIRLKFMKFKQKVSISSSLYSTGLLWKMILELIICAIHSPPWLNDVCLTFSSTTGTNHEKYRVDVDLLLSSIIPLIGLMLSELLCLVFNGFCELNTQKSSILTVQLLSICPCALIGWITKSVQNTALIKSKNAH